MPGLKDTLFAAALFAAGKASTRFLAGALAALVLLGMSTTANAQGDLRYSWFEVSYIDQDIDRMSRQFSFADPTQPQLVEIHGTDGNGIKFRGSVGTWHNIYAFLDFASSDIDVNSLVTNALTGDETPASDKFDYTSVRGGLGVKFPIRFKTDIIAELSYDTVDFDFGSLVGENFDSTGKDYGALLGVRSLFGEDLELRLYARYTNVGDVDLDQVDTFDSDVLVGAGFGYTIIRGLSITGDFEAGEFSSWTLGFRLDLDED